MSLALSGVTHGFRDPVHGAQRAFRGVLEAMSRPGSVVRLSPEAVDGLAPPESRDPRRPMSIATTAVLLALLDAETSVHLSPHLATEAAFAYLRFHTGVPPAASRETAAFSVARSGEVDAACRSRLYLGSDEVPQDGATLVIEVDRLGGQPLPSERLVLRGPGIATETRLAVSGLPGTFWAWRIGLQAEFPRGIDLILACGDRIAALPRTTRILLET